MPGETPDYGRLSSQATVFPTTDLGELAARLGSPITHDRAGDVIWWDDMEWGSAKWTETLGGTAADAAISTARARNGRSSYLLTAGSDGNRNAQISHILPVPVLSGLGFELSFSLAGVTDTVRLLLQVFDGTNLRNFIVQWRDTDNDLQRWTDPGAFVTFGTGVNLRVEPTLFHTAKLVVDAVGGDYERFILDDRSYNIAGAIAPSGADATLPNLLVAVNHIGRATFNDQIYVDDVIITINEPL
jgi:hypothetical protein